MLWSRLGLWTLVAVGDVGQRHGGIAAFSSGEYARIYAVNSGRLGVTTTSYEWRAATSKTLRDSTNSSLTLRSRRVEPSGRINPEIVSSTIVS